MARPLPLSGERETPIHTFSVLPRRLVSSSIFLPGTEVVILPSNLQRPVSRIGSEMDSRRSALFSTSVRRGGFSLQKGFYGVEKVVTGKHLTGTCGRYIGKAF